MVDTTVAICTYNRAELLKRSIQSVLNQTYKDMKIIVLDNCSTDETEQVVATFKDSRIQYIRNSENLGGVANWNMALDICETKYLNIFHDDDRMFPWMIEFLVDAMNKYPEAGIAASGKAFALGSKEVSTEMRVATGKIYGPDEYIKAVCAKGGQIAVCPSMMFRKSIVDSHDIHFRSSRNGEEDIGFARDMYLTLEANHSGVDIYIFDEALLEYTFSSPSRLGADYSDAMKRWTRTHKKIDDYITNLNLGCNMQKLRSYFAKTTLSIKAERIMNTEDIGVLCKTRSYLEKEVGWHLTDRDFEKMIMKGFLEETLMQYGAGKISFDMVRAKIEILKAANFSISFRRRMECFYKYFVIRRLLRIRK